MKLVWEVLLIVIGIFFVFLMVFAILDSIEIDKCEPYEDAGVETRVTFSDGCEVFFKGEFKRVSEVNRYLDAQELKEKLDKENQE